MIIKLCMFIYKNFQMFSEEDKEVSELTQEGPDDDSTSESSMGVPSHIPPNVQMTAESVAAFMKQVNRIRFNSMNVTSQEKTVKERPYSRSNSCPNLKVLQIFFFFLSFFRFFVKRDFFLQSLQFLSKSEGTYRRIPIISRGL